MSIVKAAGKIGLGMALSMAAVALGVAIFIGSGVYDIGADDHHTKFVSMLIERLRERSISARSNDIDVPPLGDPVKVTAGALRYSALCVGCHLAPGVMRSEIRPGLYPHAPNLAQEDLQDARRVYWTIKHGIKMSAMPAWGKILDDATIWEIVAFVRQMPGMSPETYQQLAARHAQDGQSNGHGTDVGSATSPPGPDSIARHQGLSAGACAGSAG
jgi:mono/diheme cytochrome c family protein